MTYPNYNIPIDDFWLRIGRGDLAHIEREFKFGRSSAITSAESVIWDAGGTYVFLETATTITVVSDEADDAFGGLGAQVVQLIGLDENYDKQDEVLLMAGETPVVSTKKYIRLFRMSVIFSGTNDPVADANQGTIIATSTGSATVQAQIQPNNGQTLMCVYTVPASYTAYLVSLSLSTGQGKQCYFKFKVRLGPTSDYAFAVQFTNDLYQSSAAGDIRVPTPVAEKTDIVITGVTALGSTISCSASFGMVLVHNDLDVVRYTP